jgi:hypothetical protein
VARVGQQEAEVGVARSGAARSGADGEADVVLMLCSLPR